MKFLKLAFTLPVLLFFSTSIAQNVDYDSYNLRSPMDIPLILAGNCGELRSNHFHTGIDIKTNRREGYKIYSIEDGYVARVRVSPWGYGHVVYVNHYNGLTSVYAHCQSFVGELKETVYNQQKINQGFSIDYRPPKDSLKVKKGQVIALSGNTGGSTAPHLHFEIRETTTEHVLNPLLFGFDIADNIHPTIREMKLYSLTKEGYRIPNQSKRYNVSGNNGRFNIANNNITIDPSFVSRDGGIGFAFDAIDKLDAASNVCGIFKSYLVVDGDTIFTQDMERIHFSSNRHINTHKDYEEFHSRYKHFHKSFKTQNNPLPIYRDVKNNGIIKVTPGRSYKIKYIVEDAYGNKSQLDFQLNVNEGELNLGRELYPSQDFLHPDSAFLSYNNQHYIMFPQGLLYEPTPLLLKSTKNSVSFGDDKIPLQSSYKLMLPVENNSTLNTKYYIQRKTKAGRTNSERGTTKDGWITTRTRNFGTFSVEIDTIPPSITERNFKDKAFVGGKRLTWRISETESGLESYNIFIDGEWYLLAYEPKQSSFYFDPPASLKGEKSVLIKAEDYCGNKSEKEYTLTF